MKKLVLVAVAFVVLGITSCSKEEGATPQIKNDANKVAGKTLSSFG